MPIDHPRDLSKVPIINDPRPRVSRLPIDADINSSSFKSAFLILKEMAAARGYHELNPHDVDLYLPTTFEFHGDKLQEEFNVRVHLVPCSMLKTNFTWLVRFGQDAVLSAPAD